MLKIADIQEVRQRPALALLGIAEIQKLCQRPACGNPQRRAEEAEILATIAYTCQNMLLYLFDMSLKCGKAANLY